jgi:hypothetical protein
MMLKASLILAATFTLMPQGNAQTAGQSAGQSASFAVAKAYLERNATDGDFEVVFQAKGADEGLTELKVLAPTGRTVAAFSAPHSAMPGMRQFRFETPEPEAFDVLKSTYPEGVYTFHGLSSSGAKLESRATLNHAFVNTTSFVHPKAEAKSVAVKNLKISWTPVEKAVAYIIYIEQDESEISINATLRGSVSSFDVPDGFLLPGTEYTMGIGTVAANGNTAIIETTFTTAE